MHSQGAATPRTMIDAVTRRGPAAALAAVLAALCVLVAASPAPAAKAVFKIEEATIPQIQAAIRSGRVTTTEIVEDYLKRIQAYEGTCVSQPDGLLGPITTIPHAGKLNAFTTLNLRPAHRAQWGFDAHKARSITDAADNAAGMPDALE